MTPLAIGALVSAVCLIALGVMIGMAVNAPCGFEDEERGFVEGDEHADQNNLGI